MTIGIKPIQLPINQCYDLAFGCDCPADCPDILDNDCGLYLSNSVRNQVLIALGSCKYNFFNYPFVDWDSIRSVPVNTFGQSRIQQEIENALSSVIEFVTVNVTFSRGCFLITIDIPSESYSLSSSSKDCFVDVFDNF